MKDKITKHTPFAPEPNYAFIGIKKPERPGREASNTKRENLLKMQVATLSETPYAKLSWLGVKPVVTMRNKL